jgi:flagellar basal body-associated protein FliL
LLREFVGTALAFVGRGRDAFRTRARRGESHMSDETETEKAAPEKPKGGGSKLLPVMLIMNTALIGGVLFFVMKKPSAAVSAHGEKAEGEGEEKGEGEHGEPGKGGFTAPGPILKLENFVIQLKTVDTDRYVRLAFDLEVGNEKDKEAVTAHLSHIRDLVISYFADRTLDELRGSEQMERTKATLIKRIDDIVPGHRIKNIFVTDFIVQ